MAEVLFISDDFSRSEQIRTRLSFVFSIELAPLDHQPVVSIDADCVLLIDCDLSKKETVDAYKAMMATALRPERTIFLIDGADYAGRIRTNALGGGLVMNRSVGVSTLIQKIEDLQGKSRPETANTGPADVRRILQQARRLQQDITIAVHTDAALPKEAIRGIGKNLTDVLAKHGIDTWIDAVRHYHSHTYRHCMLVTGFAIVFGQHLQLAAADVDLLAVSALLHDVGKVRIPLSILDKPGKLTKQEFDQIKLHPVYSRDILVTDGQFDPEVIDAATHHHEYIDGTGYPDGLKGAEIGPLVRMLTIADIYAALIEKRSYKPAYSNREAFQIMADMGDRLDSRLLGAFRPIVLEETFGRVRKNNSEKQPLMQPVLKSAKHPLDMAQSSAA